MNSWTNWSLGVVAAPKELRSPADEAELAAVLRDAPAPVRATGSGHSFTPLCATSGTLLSLDRMAGLVSADASALTATVRAGTKIHALGGPLYEAGLGLKNQGDIDRQSIAGAVGTGTHGTGPAHGALSAEVAAFRLVTASGETLICSPASNADIWEAGRVSFGALGVMCEITLSVRKAYRLRERTWVMPLSECWMNLDALSKAHRHFEFFWFPHADAVAAKTLDETTQDCAPPVDQARMQARGERVTRDQRLFGFGCEAARFVPWAAPHLQRWFTRASAGGPAQRVRWSHEIFPSPRTVRFNEMEYAVPAANGADCVREIAEIIRSRRLRGVFPIEFRFVKADDIWLSPFYRRDAVTISVHQYHREDCAPLFRAAEAVFRRYGGRPHWGKMHTLDASGLAALYPRFDDFRALRRRLDPKARLLNPYLLGVLGE